MPKFIVHFARTEFYDVAVEAASEVAAFDRASEIMGPEHLDRHSVITELDAKRPIERVA